MSSNLGDELLIKYGRDHLYREWATKTPYISFPADWRVKITPPFGGAMIRFRICNQWVKEDDSISVYLDVDNTMGSEDGPYWEAYCIEGSTARFMLSEVDELLSCIQDELDRRKPKVRKRKKSGKKNAK